jgi:hypothetical protein
MSEEFVALYCKHVGPAFDRALRFRALVEKKAAGAEASYDPTTAALAFGKLKFEAELLGTYHAPNGSWRWAWGDPHAKLTLTNRALGTVVKASAGKLGSPVFAAHGFTAEALLGPDLAPHAADVLGAVLARELGFDTHFVTEVNGEPAALLIRDKRVSLTEPKPVARVATVFAELVGAVPVPNPRLALAEFARDYGLTVTESDSGLTVAKGKSALEATFAAGALKALALDGTAIPLAKPKAKKRK